MRNIALMKPGRDLRIDLFRGLALVMIYIDHIPGNLYENFTSRNLGFSDAAEGFVFMSGLAAALAYGPALAKGLSWEGTSRLWGRAWLLYLVHILTAVWAIAIVSAAVQFWGNEAMLSKNAMKIYGTDPFGFLIGIATLGHQLGYVNILPMYMALLLMAPALIRIGQRSKLALLATSVGLWAATGLFRLNLPNYPMEGGWFFNPLAWQLVFSLGILTGLSLRQGKRLVPVKGWIIALAAGWLALTFVWIHNDWMLKNFGHAVWQLRQWNVPFFIAGFDKTFVSLPRLLHLLALAYILSLPGIVPRIAEARVLEPIRMLGRHSLPIFALGTVLAIAGQTVKQVHPGGIWQDSILIFGGLALQFAFAYGRDNFGAKAVARRRKARDETEPAPAPVRRLHAAE
ncbi:OpgC domain-containing protein [Thioclava sp. NG1]|uniref:OpgC family protein n=1 Tax=Thioclava sp. NG1 TaxID=2182426 RepID=UPI000D621DD2|nr:OpgC domain-containing protein [Thioclava sp. NG1]PWE49488.1 OpgC domain-containing protein [Thioclava sp. NG1]